MKRFSILVIVACISLFSCKKDESDPIKNTVSGVKEPVRFNLSDFVQKVESLPSARKAGLSGNARDSGLADKVQYIYYRVFDNNTQQLVTYLDQSYTSDSASFGVFKDSLTTGSYTLVAVAATDSVDIKGMNSLGTLGIWGRFVNYPAVLKSYPDMFTKKYSFQVGPGGYVMDVALDRIVGKLEVRLPDATYPLYRISVDIENGEFEQYDLNTGLPKTLLSTLPSIALGKANDTTFSSLMLNTSREFTVNISVNNIYTNITINKVIEHVRCYPNRKTIIRGNILSFDPNLPFGLTDLTINVDDHWDNDGPVIHY